MERFICFKVLIYGFIVTNAAIRHAIPRTKGNMLGENAVMYSRLFK